MTTTPQETAPRERNDGGGVPMLDLLTEGEKLLSPLEKAQIRFVRKTLTDRRIDAAMRWMQRHVGQAWINHSTRNLLTVHGLDRLPPLDERESFICVSNHRSFFDMYVITSFLVKRGLPHRILFPVRSAFFYDNPLGLVVNGAMSFFAMYPPVFRERERAALNLAGIDEVVRVLRGGGAFVGLHPEGTRNKGDDPYTLLPAQSGVGRMIHKARVRVLPVFVNGLVNSIPQQVITNENGRGIPVDMAFGAPVDFGDLFDRTGSGRVYRQVSQRALDAVAALGAEMKAFREARPRG